MFKIACDARIGVLGLGYVGLPVAVEFGKHMPVVGFDVSAERVAQLIDEDDRTLELSTSELRQATFLTFTNDVAALADCGVFIVTVPTPINLGKQPDLTPLISASETIGSVMQKGSLVIYESTVYPGATEEVCVPALEKASGFKYNSDFYCGYSPERINPGDKTRRLTSIVKVTSGSTPDVGKAVDELYQRIVTAGTHLASSIQVAEAAKVIENTQRDVNIALVNELALIFGRLGIDTLEVLEAAGTKWNFLPFRPGLVGGHCISVDPYYLTYKAQQIGYHPQVILSGRQINDDMGKYVAEQTVKMLARRRIHVAGSHILIMGLAFKENCPDLRNTRVVDIIAELCTYHSNVEVYDPWVSADDARDLYGVTTIDTLQDYRYDAIILAVAHRQFCEIGVDNIRRLGKPEHVLFDIKSVLPSDSVDARL